MELTHRFAVPTGLDETWAHFQDVAGLAGCFPGAQVSSVDGDDFTGSCKVKLGPIALVYNGSGTFTDRDEGAHRFKVAAKGKDRRGNGTAAATATLTMSSAPAGGTEVEVVTDLAITGKPAQFGRGLMQDVSDKLLGQFVSCLEQQLSPDAAADQPPDAPPPDAPSPDSPSPDAPSPDAAPATSTSAPVSAPTPDQAPPVRAVRSVPPPQVEALDLGATVLPVLIKSYWKQAAAGLAGLAALTVVVRLLRR